MGLYLGVWNLIGRDMHAHRKPFRRDQIKYIRIQKRETNTLLKTSSQFSSVTQSCPTLCDPTDCSTPGFPVHHQLPELTQTPVHQVGDAIQPSHPLSSPSPTFNPCQHQCLFQVSSSHQVAKVMVFQLQHHPSNEYSGLISFRMDCFDLFAVQGTLKNLLQHHSSKASVLRCSAFFTVQLTSIHGYGKNHSFD